MIKRFQIILAVFIVVLTVSLFVTGCKSTGKVPKEVRQAEKEKAAEEKQAYEEYQNAVKHHKAIQAESTKKEMKALKKQQKKINKIHRRSFWDRLFNRGCKTGK